MATGKLLSENAFPVIGVGASAGGLDAFKEMVKAIKTDSGMAYIFVQHLAPQYESMLAEILQKSTALPVLEIKNNVQVKPDHIYIIPSNKLLVANDGVLKLSPRIKGEKLNTIDLFFTSLAEIHQKHAIGVILSGTGSDGTAGLKAIKAQGGITVVQDENTAAYYGMPQSAITAEVVDFVMAPQYIPGHIHQLVHAEHYNNRQDKKEKGVTGDTNIASILSLLRVKKNVDFTQYKQTTLHRRILRRKGIHKMSSMEEYFTFLSNNKQEQDALLGDLLIQVTSFFRDPKTFALLGESVLPAVFANNKIGTIRIWLAGCSTGQEAYSVAICVREFLHEKGLEIPVQIFATDISEPAIAKARTGLYQKKEMAGLSESRMNRFFTKANGLYHVNKSIREMCVFATQNFLKDPPFVKIDLLLCRNVLIYLETNLQEKALLTFHYALADNGFLMLGKSETIGILSERFTTFSHQDKLFTRKSILGKSLPAPTEHVPYLSLKAVGIPGHLPAAKDNFRQAADDALLRSYATAGVIVDKNLDIVQFRGSTGPYLEPPPGRVSNNLIKMAREGLAYELRTGMAEARHSNEIIEKRGVLLDKGKRKVDIDIFPLKQTAGVYFLVVFKDGGEVEQQPVHHSLKKPTKEETRQIDLSNARITHLEKELSQAREDLRVITEDHELAHQELQSANEDLLSGSEELQSLNEELETTKEEVQSTNQELTILNQELIERNDQLVQSRKYAEAIVATIHEPLVILTADFKIKNANKTFSENFNVLKEQLEGMSLFESANEVWNVDGLRNSLEKILPEHSFFENFEMRMPGPRGSERILLLNARELVNENSSEQLILMAVRDITVEAANINGQKIFAQELESQVQERTAQLKEANAKLQHSNENLQQFASIASHDLQEPLRKIKTFTGLLATRFMHEVSPEAQEFIGKIQISSNRMSQLIKEVLEFSKVAQGSKEFVMTDLSVILGNVLVDLDLLIAETGATVTHMNNLPAIEASPLQMNQLFYNLLTNALKFRKKNTKQAISVDWRQLPEKEIKNHPELTHNTAYVEIVFSDSGIGFEQRFGEQIFLIFERLHSADEFEGTGIGLALCKKIVENHHGHIFSRGEKDIGSRFYVLLPVNQ